MPFKTTPEIDFSATGLVTDVPTHSLPQGAWNDCLNLRCKDGSVQGVNVFDQSIVLHDTASLISGGEVVAVTQFAPAGYAGLRLAYIVKGTDGNGKVVVYDTSTSTYSDITNSDAVNVFTFDENHPPQIFVFNEMIIVNPAHDAPPMWADAGISSGSLVPFPGWPVDSDTSPIVARVVRPFNTRLMAMNILEEHAAGTADDANLPIDILWSNNITQIGNMTGVEWTASTTNTAGDAFAVETPGKILDGGQLGEFFIAYKSDSVIRVAETGDSFVLSFESIFEDDGVYSTRCFSNIGNSQHLVVGNYGVYIHDGQSQKQDIAKGIFQDTLFALVKAANKDRSFCFQQTRDKEVWFCLPSKSITGGGCDVAFVYDYATQKLHKRSLPNLVDIYETEMDGELAIYGAKAGSQNLWTLSDTSFEPDGFFTKEDDNIQDNANIKWINRIYLDSIGSVKIGLTATQNLNDTKTYNLSSFDPSTSYKLDYRVSGRYMNIKVQMNGSINPMLGKMQFDIKPAGKR